MSLDQYLEVATIYSLTVPANQRDCSAELNNSYECPAGENADIFLTGCDSFLVDEMEVFGFENWRSFSYNVAEQKYFVRARFLKPTSKYLDGIWWQTNFFYVFVR